MYKTKSFQYKDVKIEVSPISYMYYRNHCITIPFYHPLPNLPRIPFVIDPKFKEWYIKRFQKISISEDTLTIFIRSGDTF